MAQQQDKRSITQRDGKKPHTDATDFATSLVNTPHPRRSSCPCGSPRGRDSPGHAATLVLTQATDIPLREGLFLFLVCA